MEDVILWVFEGSTSATTWLRVSVVVISLHVLIGFFAWGIASWLTRRTWWDEDPSNVYVQAHTGWILVLTSVFLLAGALMGYGVGALERYGQSIWWSLLLLPLVVFSAMSALELIKSVKRELGKPV